MEPVELLDFCLCPKYENNPCDVITSEDSYIRMKTCKLPPCTES